MDWDGRAAAGGGRAGEADSSRGLIPAGRCRIDEDLTAVGPGRRIGPSSDSELSEGSSFVSAGAGDGDAILYTSGPRSLDREAYLRSRCRDSDRSLDCDL